MNNERWDFDNHKNVAYWCEIEKEGSITMIKYIPFEHAIDMGVARRITKMPDGTTKINDTNTELVELYLEINNALAIGYRYTSYHINRHL